MTQPLPPRWRAALEPWILGLVLGTGVGLCVLGVGGRIAMRAIALASDTPPGFSIGGTATVVFLGAASGFGGGLIYSLLHTLLPRRHLARSALYALALVLLTLRGLRPIQPLALNWFMPLALAYGAIVDVGYTTWVRRRASRRNVEQAVA